MTLTRPADKPNPNAPHKYVPQPGSLHCACGQLRLAFVHRVVATAPAPALDDAGGYGDLVAPLHSSERIAHGRAEIPARVVSTVVSVAERGPDLETPDGYARATDRALALYVEPDAVGVANYDGAGPTPGWAPPPPRHGQRVPTVYAYAPTLREAMRRFIVAAVDALEAERFAGYPAVAITNEEREAYDRIKRDLGARDAGR